MKLWGWLDEFSRFERAIRGPISDKHRAALEEAVSDGRGVIRNVSELSGDELMAAIRQEIGMHPERYPQI